MSRPSPELSCPSPHLTIILVVVLVAAFFLASSFICLCKCFMENLFTNWRLHHSVPMVNVVVVSPGPGLDTSAVRSFPTFKYSDVKELRQKKHGLECTICLLEFEDESVLRLLTFCLHVFHQECIDLWLQSRRTCPVCRQDLTVPPPEKPLERSPVIAQDRDHSGMMPSIRESSDELPEDNISIDIGEGDELARG